LDKRAKLAFEIINQIKNKIGKVKHSATYSPIKGYFSETDKVINSLMLDLIKSNFPMDSIISEESYLNNDSDYCWILDPLCGTTNHLHSIPFYSNSISLKKINTIMFSFVYDPFHNELFYSDSHKSYLNDKQISVSTTDKLENSIICINCNQSDNSSIKKNLLNLFEVLAPPVTRRIHIMESANLELAYVSCGRIDAYVNFADKIWDITSGETLIRTSGGKSMIYNSKHIKYDEERGIIASNSLIHEELLTLLSNNDYI